MFADEKSIDTTSKHFGQQNICPIGSLHNPQTKKNPSPDEAELFGLKLINGDMLITLLQMGHAIVVR